MIVNFKRSVGKGLRIYIHISLRAKIDFSLLDFKLGTTHYSIPVTNHQLVSTNKRLIEVSYNTNGTEEKMMAKKATVHGIGR